MTKQRILQLTLISFAYAALLGCSGKPTTYTVKIEQKGADGSVVAEDFANSVNGVCNTAEGGGRTAHELTGAGNFTDTFSGTFISCKATAKNASNILIMTITRADGSVVGTSQSSAQSRSVTVEG